MGKKIDMTGWVMKEHGILESKLIVLEEEKNYAKLKGLKIVALIGAVNVNVAKKLLLIEVL